MAQPKLLLALHDVAPVHRARIDRAERLFRDLGVSQVAYLLVPNYHGLGRADRADGFPSWCRAERPFRIQWFLHGHFHDTRPRADVYGYDLSWAERVAARVGTAGEAECLALAPIALRSRLATGRAIVEACVGATPVGFVAPAWLFNHHLLPVLAEQGFAYTESHRRVIHVPTRRERVTPVVTWATRTWLHRRGSIAAASIARRLLRQAPVIRLALHPFDFDHAGTVESLSRTIAALGSGRAQAGYDETLFDSTAVS